MRYVGKIQKLYRIAIPKNVYTVMGFKVGDVINVDVVDLSAVSYDPRDYVARDFQDDMLGALKCLRMWSLGVRSIDEDIKYLNYLARKYGLDDVVTEKNFVGVCKKLADVINRKIGLLVGKVMKAKQIKKGEVNRSERV